MRKRRICYAGALGLALAVAVPATAMASATQNVEAGFSPGKNANVVFGQTAKLSNKFSKNGTLRTALFFSNIVGDPPSLETADVHLPEEVKFTSKGLKTCNPAAITGQTPEAATAACKKSLVGTGFATALNITTPGVALLFNGKKQNGNPTILVHIFTANVPIVLVAELQNSRLGSPYGKVLHVPVSTSVGGGVPPGVVVTRTELTKISKTFTVRKKGKKKKVSFVRAKCTDGTLSYRVDFFHAPPDLDQSPTYEEPCTK